MRSRRFSSQALAITLGLAALFGVFLAEAALADWLAIADGGASGWCVTPAYAFPIPAYGCLWAAGLWCAGRPRDRWRAWVRLAAALAGRHLRKNRVRPGSDPVFG